MDATSTKSSLDSKESNETLGNAGASGLSRTVDCEKLFVLGQLGQEYLHCIFHSDR